MDLKDYFIIFFFVSLYLGVWWYGHYGMWSKFVCGSELFVNNAQLISKSGFDISFSLNDRWRGGYYAYLWINADEGIVFKCPMLMRHLLPDLCVKWSDIKCIDDSGKNFINKKCTKITLHEKEISILVPLEVGALIIGEDNNRGRPRFDNRGQTTFFYS